MTKQELSSYFWLKNEIAKQEKRKQRLQEKLTRNTNEAASDTVRDYRSGKGIPVRIEGVPAEEFSLPIMIRILEEEIEKNIKESEKAVVKIEKYIQSIESPQIRELLRSRFIDCLGWKEVGERNYISPDYARKLIRNFIK